MTSPTPARCDQCGQTDTDPKLHYGAFETYHHDCVPARVLDDLTSTTTFGRDAAGNQFVSSRTPIPEAELHPNMRHTLAVIEAAKSGTRGEALRAHAASIKPQEG